MEPKERREIYWFNVIPVIPNKHHSTAAFSKHSSIMCGVQVTASITPVTLPLLKVSDDEALNSVTPLITADVMFVLEWFEMESSLL